MVPTQGAERLTVFLLPDGGKAGASGSSLHFLFPTVLPLLRVRFLTGKVLNLKEKGNRDIAWEKSGRVFFEIFFSFFFIFLRCTCKTSLG